MFLKVLFSVSLLWWLELIVFTNPHPTHIANKNIRTDSSSKFSNNFLPAHFAADEIIVHKGYTLCYAEKYEQAKWVAYHLTSTMCSNNEIKRTNKFRADKAVKTGSATPNDYKKSGYDRGHLCPAGDMGWNKQAMSESFLMSNMSPQKPGFNRGIWEHLEEHVRKWAMENEDIYVVTAGVLTDNLPTIGKNKVAVPHYFYKVILDYRLPEYKAIAFVLPNQQDDKDSIFKFAVSIDSVERLTGIDFFPALDNSIENKLESHFEIKDWN